MAFPSGNAVPSQGLSLLKRNLRKTAFGGFAIGSVEIEAGFFHGFDDLVKGDFAGVPQKACKADGVDGAHRGNGVALDAGDLNETADGVAGQSQMMLAGDLGSVLDLVNVQGEQLTKSRGSHCAGGANLSLAAALRTRDGRVGLDQIANDARRDQRFDHFAVAVAVLLLLVFGFGVAVKA